MKIPALVASNLIYSCVAFTPATSVTGRFGLSSTRHTNTAFLQLQLQDLEPGDVVCFSPEEGDCTSELIVLLTGENVSHAAIMYDSTRIVEETPPNIRYSNAKERFKGRTITVNRLSNPPPGPNPILKPVLEKAEVYAEQEIPYGWSELFLVGILLLKQKKLNVDSKLSRSLTTLFKWLAANARPQWLGSAKGKMFCSQFVFQCFKDAGDGYMLQIGNPVIEFAGKQEKAALQVSSLPDDSLLEQAMMQLSAMTESEANSTEDEEVLVYVGAGTIPKTPAEIMDAICEILKASLEADKEKSFYKADYTLDTELVLAISEFAVAVERASLVKESPAVSKTLTVQARTEAMAVVKNAVLVTPADLLKGCTNLERVGVLEIQESRFERFISRFADFFRG